MEIGKLSVEELRQGYRFDAEDGAYVCHTCGQPFHEGQVYPDGDRYFTAAHAAAWHVRDVHGGSAALLIHLDSKYNGLTDHQRDLLSRIAAGQSDRDIAKALFITEATVRRQRFNFREKAKQAKLYLATYQQVFETEAHDELMPIHDAASFVDDRYVITEQERAKILKNSFSSLSPPRLKTFPPKEKKKVVILTEIAKQFTAGSRYTEREVNDILRPIFADFVSLRRFLIIYGLMRRTKDGSAYWLAD